MGLKCRVEEIHNVTNTIQSHKYGRIERLNGSSEKKTVPVLYRNVQSLLCSIHRICCLCRKKSGIQSPAMQKFTH
jgi:hypothetical protein